MTGVVLGSAFQPRLPPPPPTEQETLLAQVLDAMAALRAAVETLPAPQVTVQPQDLSDIVTAVQSLNGPAGPTAGEIALAIKDVLAPALNRPAESALPVTELVEALKTLDFRMKGIGSSVGGTVATISNDVAVKPAAGTNSFPVSGPLTDTQLRATPVPVSGTVTTTAADNRTLTERMIARAPASGYTLWLDVTSTSATTIYIAEAANGTQSSAAGFRGIKLTLDASGNPLGGVAYNTNFTWDNRASATWST